MFIINKCRLILFSFHIIMRTSINEMLEDVNIPKALKTEVEQFVFS